MLLFIILIIVFSIPAVQTSIAGRITDSINEKNDVDISIGRIDLSYFGDVTLENLLIRDYRQDTLIFAEEVTTSVESFSRLLNNNPVLGETEVRDLELHMKVYPGETRDNLAIFINKLKNKKKKKTSAGFILAASEVNVIDSEFSFTDFNARNPKIIAFDHLNILARDLLIDGNEVSVAIEKFSGLEDRGLRIKNLTTDFTYTTEELSLDNLLLRTENSLLDMDVSLDISKGFSNFEDRVDIDATVDQAVVSSNDLQLFYRGFGEDELLEFTTDFTGTLNDFKLNDLRLRGISRSTLKGDLHVRNLLDTREELFTIDAELDRLETSYYDLISLLPGLLDEKLPEQLREFGKVRIEGDALITGKSLDADVLLYSPLGNADVDMELGNFNNSKAATYHGVLKVEDFDLGQLLDVKALGETTFDLNIDGRGFTRESLNTQIRGAISSFEYNDYNYKDIKVRGTLKAPLFNGDLISFDPNLQLEFNGLADFSEDINIYDFRASVKYADLAALNFIDRDSTSILKGDIFINMIGTNLNNAVGEINLLNTSYKNDNDTYFFDDLEITSSFDGPVRTIKVNSPDVINGTVRGVFDIAEVDALFENALGSLYTNYRPNELTNDQYLEFNFDVYNKIVELFFPQITLAPNTYISGRVESDDSEFRLNFRSPEIRANGNLLQNVNIQVDNTNPLFNTYIEIDSIDTDFYDLSEFNLINVTLNDTLFVRSEFRGGPENDDIFNLNLYHTINEDNNSVVGFQKSNIKFKESLWYINERENNSNRVIFNEGFSHIILDSIQVSHEDELIRLSGEMRDSLYKNFLVKFDNVDLEKISPEIKKLDLGGIVNGNLNLLQKNGAYYPSSSLTIKNFAINDYLMGDLNLDVMGNKDLSLYNVNTTLTRDGVESLSAIGGIFVDQEFPVINLDVDLQDLSLRPFEPIGGEAIGNIRGLVSGDAFVSGNYKNPDITGRLVVENAGFSIPYLGVDYALEEDAVVNLEEQKFIFEDITLIDTEFETTGLLDGVISHENFSRWMLGLNVSTDRLLVLNTEEDEDALFYGTAFISGNAAIYGPTEELVIDVLGATERGTVFNIPIEDQVSIGDISYIHFLSPEEKAARLAGEEIVFEEVKGLELNFDLDVTSEALVEIEIDESILRGRGAGTLLIEINTLGKFNMWGDFIVNTGEYIFKYGALQKRFEVLPGGSINWSGEPAQADLDISAVYEAYASPAIILENPSVNRRIPVDVVIHLENELVQPEFSFDLEFPNVTSAVRSELEYKIETNANTEIQAFSLITLGQFYTPNVLAGNSASAVTGNLFESASGFFNSLFSDESGVFQVGLNYEQGARTPEQNTADRFGVTLTTQISERVLINGKVGVPIGGVTETVVVGNLEIEFLLNEEGTLRATIFNRENNIQYIGEELGFTQGIGLSYHVDFDTFKELLNKIVNKEIEKTPQEEKQEESPKTLVPDYIRFPGEGEFY